MADRGEELLGSELTLTKFDVAKEQLDTAIRLFFEEESYVSQHTLVSAAHGVLRDIALRKEIKVSVKDSPLVAESERGAFLKQVHLAQNFFKHGDKDANARLAFRHKVVPLFVFDAIILWYSLEQEPTRPMLVFLMWLQLEFPELLSHQAAEKYLSSIRESTDDSKSFIVLGRALLAEGKRKGDTQHGVAADS